MAGLLGHDAHLVSYGAMSKQPLSLPTSLFIFKNLTSHGFWQSRWYKQHTREERENLMNILADLIKDGKVQLFHTFYDATSFHELAQHSSKNLSTRLSRLERMSRTKRLRQRLEMSLRRCQRVDMAKKCC